MAALPGNTGKLLGALAMGAGKFGLKAVMVALTNNQPLVERIAAAVYEEETGGTFAKLGTTERVLWTNRVRATIRAASSMVNV